MRTRVHPSYVLSQLQFPLLCLPGGVKVINPAPHPKLSSYLIPWDSLILISGYFSCVYQLCLAFFSYHLLSPLFILPPISSPPHLCSPSVSNCHHKDVFPVTTGKQAADRQCVARFIMPPEAPVPVCKAPEDPNRQDAFLLKRGGDFATVL